MSRLLRVEVTPLNAQIEISDPDFPDYPQWQTGEEAVVALPQVVAVATQSDMEGKVVVEVWLGALEVDDLPVSDPCYDGEFVAGDRVVVGNTVGNEFYDVPVRPGLHRLRVFTSPAAQATTVYFLLG